MRGRPQAGGLGALLFLVLFCLLGALLEFVRELQEPPGNLAMISPKVVAARKALFGAWEGNWVAFNDAHDVKLPGSNEPAIAFLMYPQAENKAGFLDSLDPDKFKYRITARELSA